MTKPVILLDMDGVICNWVEGACYAHNRPDLADLAALGLYPKGWDMDGELGNDDEVWIPIDKGGEEFWYDLNPYEWMNELIEMLNTTKIPWHLCTHARKTPESHSGKIMWIERYLPNHVPNVVMTKHKHLLAGSSRLLIDDNDGNCEKFVSYGGRACLFPQPWNSRKDLLSARLEVLQVTLDKFQEEVYA